MTKDDKKAIYGCTRDNNSAELLGGKLKIMGFGDNDVVAKAIEKELVKEFTKGSQELDSLTEAEKEADYFADTYYLPDNKIELKEGDLIAEAAYIRCEIARFTYDMNIFTVIEDDLLMRISNVLATIRKHDIDDLSCSSDYVQSLLRLIERLRDAFVANKDDDCDLNHLNADKIQYLKDHEYSTFWTSKLIQLVREGI